MLPFNGEAPVALWHWKVSPAVPHARVLCKLGLSESPLPHSYPHRCLSLAVRVCWWWARMPGGALALQALVASLPLDTFRCFTSLHRWVKASSLATGNGLLPAGAGSRWALCSSPGGGFSYALWALKGFSSVVQPLVPQQLSSDGSSCHTLAHQKASPLWTRVVLRDYTAWRSPCHISPSRTVSPTVRVLVDLQQAA